MAAGDKGQQSLLSYSILEVIAGQSGSVENEKLIHWTNAAGTVFASFLLHVVCTKGHSFLSCYNSE